MTVHPSYSLIVKKAYLRLALLLSVVYLVLVLYYCFYISDRFDYMRYTWDPDLLKIGVIQVVFLLLLAGGHFLYLHSKFLCSVFMLLLFFFYIPSSILYAFGNYPNGPFFSNVFFVSSFLLAPFLPMRLPALQLTERYRSWAVALSALLLLLPFVLVFGSQVNLNTLLLREVYETRAAFDAKLSTPMNYLYHLETKLLIPLAIAFFLILRKYFLSAVFVIALVYLYVISGNRIVYFGSLIVVIFCFVGRNPVEKLASFFLVMLGCFMIFPLLDLYVMPEPVLSGVFVNRFLFIPSLLSQFYFDFFDGNPFFFAESHFFSSFVKSPYDLPVGYLITREYWGMSDAYANNGVVSDGFMNLGYAGVLVFSLIVAFIFRFFDRLNLHKGYFGLFFCYVYILLSAPMLASLVTFGLGAFMIMALLLLRSPALKNTG